MPTFTIDGRDYQLITLDNLPDMELGELEILEDVGGVDIAGLDGGAAVTVKLVIALVYISMLRSDPAARLVDARKAKVSVVEALAAQVANEASDDVRPPTGRATNGRPRSKNTLASSRGR